MNTTDSASRQEERAEVAAAITRFHLSLNVADLDRSIAFLAILFGASPAKRLPDYAKFELDEPPLVVSLQQLPPQLGGALNHLGFRVPDSGVLVEMQRRVEAAGIATQREDGVECCHARQTKFWLHDPDGNLWEVYTLDDDHVCSDEPVQLDTRMTANTSANAQPRPSAMPARSGNASSAKESAPIAQPASSLWQHRLGQPLPTKLFVHDATVDEVRLEGTFNARTSGRDRQQFLGEVVRALRPGGTLSLYMLTADRPADDATFQLPGPAAAVEVVPELAVLLQELSSAGLVNLQLDKLADHSCFQVGDIQLRETRIHCQKPDDANSQSPADYRVVYKGPAASMTLDSGLTIYRGTFTRVNAATWQALRSHASQFLTLSASDN